ncbi:MAG: thiamine-phosphate kinase [Candidatus Omnitrophica bacterium]|nr:thiamine-phosphate kinase [Candidatus Omnitrophota bacterium]
MAEPTKRNTIQRLGEFGLIRQIEKWIPKPKAVRQGMGDDTAVVQVAGCKYALLTMDTLVEDVDFKVRTASAQAIGRKALAVNLSDIAAMGGLPKAAVVSLTLPKTAETQFVKRFYRGLGRIAKRFGVSIVGGDLSRGEKMVISVALLGEAKHPVLRKGARIGDLICVTGRLGGSILGKHLHFEPRIREGEFLACGGVSAMIDLSDGLAGDLNHLSKPGIAFLIDGAGIPIAKAAYRLARGNRKKALEHALSDGEDFELLFTISPRKLSLIRRKWRRRFSVPLTTIGKVVKRRHSRLSIQPHKGFQHF